MKGRRYKRFSEILMLINSVSLDFKTKKSKPSRKASVLSQKYLGKRILDNSCSCHLFTQPVKSPQGF